jgi:hypothetical protein
MNVKLLVFLIGTYILSLSLNFVPSIKHPDATITILSALATSLFLLTFMWFSQWGIPSHNGNRKYKAVLMLGIVSCVLVYLIKTFENYMFEFVILDAITAIQYPLYVLFVTPFFGANLLFDLNYGLFSLTMVIVYALALLLNKKRINHQQS